MVSRPPIFTGQRSDLLLAHPRAVCLCVKAYDDTMRLLNERALCTSGGGDIWFAHLAVNQPFDVPNINKVIYSAGGGSDEVEVTDTFSLSTEQPPVSESSGKCVF